jgi:hypothetical protein
MTGIVFTDIRDREALARKAFSATYKPPGGKIPDPGSIYKDGSPSHLYDRVFRVLREAASTGRDHTDGKFEDLTDSVPPAAAAEVKLAAAMGYLLRDGLTDPLSEPSTDAIYRALAEYQKNPVLHSNVLELICGARRIPGHTDIKIVAAQWVATVRSIADDAVAADDPRLSTYVDTAYAKIIGADDGQPSSGISISLQDFEDNLDVEIVADNLFAIQALFYAWSFEDLRMFQVVDKLVELFNQGLLPITRNRAGDLLYRYWKRSIERFTEVERRNLYARVFGAPGGEPTVGNPNREFSDLWLRFVSAVSEFTRQQQLDNLLRNSADAMPVSLEQVRKSGRDLAANLSLYGYGVAYFAATDLQAQINDMADILKDPEVRSAYGAKDMWQVIDQVALIELGGNRNAVRYRTVARAGAVIIRWLAQNAKRLGNGNSRPLIDTTAPVPADHRPLDNPTDSDLVEACQQWLAVTGTPDQRIEEFAQPNESPNTTSRPLPFSTFANDVARNALQAAGLNSASLPLS